MIRAILVCVFGFAALAVGYTKIDSILHPEVVDPYGVYYRMKVGLTYRGQPIDIDIVAGCAVHASFSRASGGSTVEAMGMSAFVFGAKMPEGHAVVIRTVPVSSGDGFDVCLGATTNSGPPRTYRGPADARLHEVPKEWLPFITWYERDDNFAHGIGYATQDAYENPRARFGFRSASIEHATRQEFETFVRDGPPNLIPPHLADAMGHLGAPRLPNPVPDDILRDPTKAWIYSGSPFCHGVMRARLDDNQRSELRRFWPADHPKYWTVEGNRDLSRYIHTKVLREDQFARSLSIYHRPGSAQQAETVNKVFPVTVGERLDNIAKSTVEGTEFQIYDREILIGDGKDWLGYEFCEARPNNDMIAVFSKNKNTAPAHTCIIEGQDIGVAKYNCDIGLWMAFDSDEYAILPLPYFQD